MNTYIKHGLLSMVFFASCVEVEPEASVVTPIDEVYINTLHSGTTSDLLDVHFFNETDGIVVGGADYLTTLDAGLTWAVTNPVEAEGDTIAHFNKVHFTSDTKGFLLGNKGVEYYDTRDRLQFETTSNVILKTTDGGETWSDINFLEETITINAISFYNENIGILSIIREEDGELYKTSDGGNTWSLVLSGITTYGHHGDEDGSFGLADVTFVSENKVVGIGTQGTVYVSLDAGNTWTKDNNAPEGRGFKRVQFFNETEGYIVGGEDSYPNEDKAMVFKVTLDEIGTLTYEDQTDTYHSVFYFNGVHATEEGDLWVCGHLGQVFATYDQGVSWSDELTKTSRESDLNDLEFPTNNVGYFVGEDGIILKVNLEE